jgi:hypothetical protein
MSLEHRLCELWFRDWGEEILLVHVPCPGPERVSAVQAICMELVSQPNRTTGHTTKSSTVTLVVRSSEFVPPGETERLEAVFRETRYAIVNWTAEGQLPVVTLSGRHD